jgi:DHA1 family bicyclomycin/chloramphenicol resistance-like MFS transporter
VSGARPIGGDARDSAVPGEADPATPGLPRWLLIFFIGIGPVSFQIFLPALPAISLGLDASPATTNLTVSLSMLAFGFATLFYGRLADRLGRRPMLLVGMSLLLAGSFICASAPSIEIVIAGRIVQSAGGAAGLVVTRAMVFDMYPGPRAGQVMASLVAAMMIAPMLGFALGGVLADTFGWRSNFAAIGIAAAIALLLMRQVRETRPPTADAGKGGLLRDYARVIRSRTFHGFALQGGLTIAAMTVFQTAAPFALTGTNGLTAAQIGLVFAGISGAYLAGALIAARLPLGLTSAHRVLAGSSASALAGAAALTLALMGYWTVAALVVPVLVVGLASGITSPASQTGAVGAVAGLSGTASGLWSFMSMVLAAAATQIVSTAADGTPVPVAAGFALLTLLALALAAILLRERRPPLDA